MTCGVPRFRFAVAFSQIVLLLTSYCALGVAKCDGFTCEEGSSDADNDCRRKPLSPGSEERLGWDNGESKERISRIVRRSVDEEEAATYRRRLVVVCVTVLLYLCYAVRVEYRYSLPVFRMPKAQLPFVMCTRR